MGGIKNRDAKRAQAKVFTSGGGGGSKGPAKVDKRNQELKCPHCDKLYKQASRLQDHIKKQHAETAQQVAATNPQEPVVARAPKEVLMDVGSRGGFYSAKSPKLLLHEWCLKERLPKPRYKTLPGAEGRYRARVVLPHPKKSELDKLLILPERESADNEEEAQQRAAVLGLHSLAGDRSVDTLLPQGYRDLWRRLTEQAEKARQREAAAAERVARAQAKQKAAAARAARGGVGGKLVMTETHRQLVSDALGELRIHDDDDDEEDVGIANRVATPEEHVLHDDDAGSSSSSVTELVKLGFRKEDALRAIEAADGSIQQLLDWLCRNLPESALPKRFAPGAAGKGPEVILGPGGPGRSRQSSLASLKEISESSPLEDPGVARLVDYGFSVSDAVSALEQAKGNVLEALEYLYKLLCAKTVHSANSEQNRSTKMAVQQKEELVVEQTDPALWTEEMEALEAIFGTDNVSAHEENNRPCVTVSLASNLSDLGKQVAIDLLLVKPTVETTRDNLTSGYPFTAPLIAVRSPGLKPLARLCLTRSLGILADQRRGQPVLFELCQAACDEVESAIEFAARQWTSEMGDLRQLTMASSAAGQQQEQEDIGSSVESRGVAPRKRAQMQLTRDIAYARTQSEALQRAQRAWEESKAMAGMRAVRATLPAAKERARVVASLSSSRVLVIEGATGCGKSTQVPQFILEDAVRRGEGGAINIICTQPRRISAVGLATRVAAERGERVGATVGYAVRLDSRQSRDTRLLFCTTGILLRRLLSEPDLPSCTHIIIDEVHERSVESDLLLLLLRRLLVSGANEKLRIVLMSATADAQLFADYFDSVLIEEATARVAIPGFTHPVQEFYLEDVLELTGIVIGPNSPYAKDGRSVGPRESRYDEEGDSGDQQLEGRRNLDKPRQTSTTSALPSPLTTTTATADYSYSTLTSLEHVDESKISYDLIAQLVDKLRCCPDKKNSSGKLASRAVLIFVSGAEEIDRTIKGLRTLPKGPTTGKDGMTRLPVHALPLHGGLPAAEQARVFDPPPPGSIKVVVSTNVAETSITIDDVVCVIDTGRVKEMAFDPGAGLNRLTETWVSQAAAQQRRGRAGRVRAGQCYRLFTHKRWGSLARDTAPEIHRIALRGLVLDIKGVLGAEANVWEAAEQMLTPPRPVALKQGDLFESFSPIVRGELLDGEGFIVMTVLNEYYYDRVCEQTQQVCDNGITVFLSVTALHSLIDIGALTRPQHQQLGETGAGDSLEQDPAKSSSRPSKNGRPTIAHQPQPHTSKLNHEQLMLTPLGRHLTAMPCEPPLGKMLIYGCLLRCLDPVLTIAAAMAHGRPIFPSPSTSRAEADRAHRRLTESVAGSQSDHLNLIAAFSAWRNSGSKPGFCRDYYLSMQGLQAVAAGRRQLASILVSLGFCDEAYLRTLDKPKPLVVFVENNTTDVEDAHHPLDATAGSARVVKAAITAGLYPHLLRVDSPPPRFQKVHGGSIEIDPEPGSLKLFDRTRGRVFLHPSSCNFAAAKFPSGWLVFSEITQTSKVFARFTTAVPAYSVLLFAGELAVDHLGGTITAGGWAKFKAPARIAVLIHDLRAAVSALLARKIEDPALDLSSSPIRRALHSLLIADGT